MLSKEDLAIVPHRPRMAGTLDKIPTSSLCSMLEDWFDTPEIKTLTLSRSIKSYDNLTKKDIIKKMTTEDWPLGFHALQLAQIDLRALINDTRPRKWTVLRMMKQSSGGKLRLDMESSAIEESIRKFLSEFYYCYLYSLHDKESDLYWMRIQLTSRAVNEQSNIPKVAFIVYYPHTEYILMTDIGTGVLKDYIREAIAFTFNADRIQMQTIRGDVTKHLTEVIKTRKSQGVFAQLRNNQVDANPLDIRQKRTSELGEDAEYVKGGEKKRRIKPIDREKHIASMQSIMNNFGWEHVNRFRTFTVNVNKPFVDGKDVRFKMTMKGESVPSGVKTMLKKGQIKTPVPAWIEAIGTTNINRVNLVSEGANEMTESDSDDSLSGDGESSIQQ